MSQQLLSHVRILDMAQGRAGALAAMLLAEAGAQVVRLEPVGGDADRAEPGWAVRNRSKWSLELDTAAASGQAQFEALLPRSDILITDQLDGAAIADIVARFPHLIVTRVGAWPIGHPSGNMDVDELLAMADCGACDEQPALTRDGPAYLRFPLGENAAAYLAAIGTAARLIERERTGGGGLVDTSLVQGALTSLSMFWSRAEHSTPSLDSGYRKGNKPLLFECADGGWMHVMSSPDATPTMAAALEDYGMEAREAAAVGWPKTPVMPNCGVNALIFRTKPRDYWLNELWAHDVSVQPVLPLGDLYGDEQAKLNGYVVEVDDAQAGAMLQPGSPLHIVPEACVRRPAPDLDDGRTVVDAWEPRVPGSGDANPGLPLAGVKILDLGNFLAGPFATMILASMGAEVVKLEAASGDPMRRVEWAFTGCQAGKRSLALDLKAPDSRAVLARAIEWADVVHHNLRMPAARRLGLDYEAVAAVNPDIVYCHISSYGPQGPRKDWPGFDQLFQAATGWEIEGAGAGNPPMWYRFGFLDHHCALASTLATLLALHGRQRTGLGSAVGASLLSAAMFTLHDTPAAADGAMLPYPRLDHAQLGVSEQRRLFQCDDGWVAVVTEAPGSHACFLAALTANDIAAAEARVSTLPAAAVIAIAIAAGGTAALAREDNRLAFLDDPANREAGLVQTRAHPSYGRFEQVGGFLYFGGPHGDSLPPPLLGQHSAAILTELGFEYDDIMRMTADGLVIQGASA